MGSLRVALEQQIPEADWAQARFDQLNLLDERRLRAADHVRAYQRKMARAFKKRVRPRHYGLGVDPEGAAWLMDLDGNRFSEPTNVDQLKRHWFRDPWFEKVISSERVCLLPYHLGVCPFVIDIIFGVRFVHVQDIVMLLLLGVASLRCRSDSVVFGLPGSFMDPHGLARPSLTGCSSRRGHDRLSYGASEIHTAGSALLDTWIPSCLSTWEVACVMMDDFMTFVLRTCHAPDAILGIFPFWGHISVRMRFTDHEGVACLALFGEMADRVHLMPYWGIFPSFSHGGDRSLTCPSRSPSLAEIYCIRLTDPACHTGAYFPHIVSLQSGVQSRRSFTVYDIQSHHVTFFKPSSLLLSVSAFRVVIGFQIDVQSRVLGFGVQSRYHFLASVFRAIITTSLSFGVQSHHRLSDRHSESHPRFRRSEPSSVFRSTFRVAFSVSAFRAITTSQFRRSEPSSVFRSTFRVAFSVSAFRVIITSQLRRSEPSPLLSFGVQSRHRFSDRRSESRSRFRRSESLSLLSFGVQSHHHFSVSAFRAVIGFQIDVQSRVLGFGVQSRYHFSASVFRAIITTSLSFGVQSRYHFSVSVFRAIITTSLSFGVQSHHRFSDRHSESPPRFRRLESLSLLSLTFRVIIITSQFRRSELSSVFRSTFRVASSVSTFRVIIITSQFRRSELSSIFRSTFRVISSVSAFRVVITSQFDVQSHHHHFLVSAFRAIIDFQIDIQSRILSYHRFSDRHSESHPRFRHSESLSLLSLTFRVIIITSQFRRSELSSIFRSTFRVPSSVSAFRVVITSQFDVQSHHHHFSVSAFRAIIDFQIDIQSPLLGFGVQSQPHPRFRRSESLSLLSLTFRVIIITSQFRRSELSSIFRSIFRVISSVSAFRVVITSQFDVQSHHHHFSVSAFRAIIGFQIDIQSRILESALSSRVTTPGVHIHWLCASCLHGFALSLDFSSLRYPVFIVYSSRSPHRVVPFGRILARTPGWCDNYSSLTLISWVAFRDILEGVWVLDAALEGMQGFWAADGMCSRRAEDGLLRKTRGEEEGFCLRGFTQNLWDIATFPIGQVESQQVKGTEKASITLSSMVSLLATPTDVMVDVGIGASLNVLTKGDRALGIAHMPNCTTPDGDIDWDSFCVSLWGPVPISSLPDATTKPPRQGSRELLLDGGVNGVESN
ncbi:hypothetical protein CK203_082106 [Vitis vinifera]|uniref:Uncharacterized protein n=1 Tax=Vitis vinifera TaxID=29760 RepID=A0A438CMV2_VITVI|nr:hypothetical protein CK203_082106 [Vitis vinifera]